MTSSRHAAAIVTLIAASAASISLSRQANAAGHPHAHAAIIGGTAAPVGSFPSLAFIADNEGTQYGLCTGTVVSPNIVLTAAHCVYDLTTGQQDPASNYLVVTGSVDWTDQTARQVSGVAQTIVYPGFDPTTLDGDAALLVLSTPTTAPPITLATAADIGLLQPGTGLEIAGWGDTIGGQLSEQFVLNWGTTVAQSPGYCALNAGADGLPFNATTQLCAIDPNFEVGTCHGDSGGPALATNAANTLVEVGITSFSDPNCDTTVPDDFTRVDYVSPWISQEVAAFAPAPPPIPTPTPTPAPTPSATIPASPSNGKYTGHTSQHAGHVRLTLSTTGITRLNLEWDWHCPTGRRGPYTETATWKTDPITLTDTNGTWGFATSYQDANTNHYNITATFPTPNAAKGTLQVTGRTGACTTRHVNWTASLATT